VADVVVGFDHSHAHIQPGPEGGADAVDGSPPAAFAVCDFLVNRGIRGVEGCGYPDLVALKALNQRRAEQGGVGEDLDKLEASTGGPLDEVWQPRVHCGLAANELDSAATQFGCLIDHCTLPVEPEEPLTGQPALTTVGQPAFTTVGDLYELIAQGFKHIPNVIIGDPKRRSHRI